MPPQSPAAGVVFDPSRLVSPADGIVGIGREVDHVAALTAQGLDRAALVLHEERGVLELERRAGREDEGGIERDRGAAVVDHGVAARRGLEHESLLRTTPVIGLRCGVPGRATTTTGPLNASCEAA